MKRIVVTLALLSLPAVVFASADVPAGKKVYESKCKMCHGADGKGGAGYKLSIAGMNDSAVKQVVHVGKGKMKPMPTIIGDDLDNVCVYVMSLKK